MNTHYTCKMTCLQRHPWITRMYFFINLPWEKFITDLLSRNLRRWKRKVFFPECDFLNQLFIKNLKKLKVAKKFFMETNETIQKKIELFWWPEICFDATKMFFWSAIFFLLYKKLTSTNFFWMNKRTIETWLDRTKQMFETGFGNRNRNRNRNRDGTRTCECVSVHPAWRHFRNSLDGRKSSEPIVKNSLMEPAGPAPLRTSVGSVKPELGCTGTGTGNNPVRIGCRKHP